MVDAGFIRSKNAHAKNRKQTREAKIESVNRFAREDDTIQNGWDFFGQAKRKSLFGNVTLHRK
jgi:hypothetical protein